MVKPAVSPILFTMYLAKGMNVKDKKSLNDHSCYTNLNVNSESLVEEHMENHNYGQKINSVKLIDLQYADDIGWIGNSRKNMNNIEQNITEKLKERNLMINNSKTEKIKIRKNEDEKRKNCKNIGSF